MSTHTHTHSHKRTHTHTRAVASVAFVVEAIWAHSVCDYIQGVCWVTLGDEKEDGSGAGARSPDLPIGSFWTEEPGSASSVTQYASAVVVKEVRLQVDAEGETKGESDDEGYDALLWEMRAKETFGDEVWKSVIEREEEIRKRETMEIEKEKELERMALLCSLSSNKMDLEHKRGYVQLRNPFSGIHYALPGVGKAPHFKVPIHAFQAQDIVGKYLVAIDWNEDGVYTYKRKEPNGELELSNAPVNCFMAIQLRRGQEGAIYSYGCLSKVAGTDSWVGVKFGHEEEKLSPIERPCADVEGVKIRKRHHRLRLLHQVEIPLDRCRRNDTHNRWANKGSCRGH